MSVRQTILRAVLCCMTFATPQCVSSALAQGRPKVTDAVLREAREKGRLHVLFLQTRFVGDTRPDTDAEIVEINVVDQPVTDAGLKELAGLKKLRTLYLSRTLVTDAGMKELAPLTSLQSLWLTEMNLTDAALKPLAELKKLEALYLTGSPITDKGIKELAAIPSLNTLNLDRTKVSDAGLKDIALLKSLHTLYLEPAQITDLSLRLLRETDRLHVLWHARSKEYKKRPASAAEITGLNLMSAPVTDAGLKEIAGLTSLEWITVHRTKMSDKAIAELPKMFPALKKIHR
jgi:internalin A